MEGITAAQDAWLSVSKSKQVRPDESQNGNRCSQVARCDETSLGTNGAEEFNRVRQDNVMPGRILTSLLTWQ